MAASLPFSGGWAVPFALCPSSWHPVSSRSVWIVTEWVENSSPHSMMTKCYRFTWEAGPRVQHPLPAASAQTERVHKLLVKLWGRHF